jgi:uncharacterized protein
VVKLLVGEKWINSEVTDKEMNTAMHVACERGYPLCIEVLIHLRANPDVQNSKGKTPLVLAVGNFNLDCVKVLVEKFMVDKSIVDEDGNTALHIAIKKR